MTTDKNTLKELLAAEFEPHQVLHFQGRGGQTFDYVEDETVMDRLDEVLGLGAVSFAFDVISDTCVRGTMIIAWPDGERSSDQDFGYATRANSDEPLKEAVSDAIRRLGRYVGVARYLYRKHETTQTRQNAPQRPAQVRPAPAPTMVDDVPPEPFDIFDDGRADPYTDGPRPAFPPIGQPANAVPSNECPIHRVPWAGGPGDYWHKDPDGKYCRHPDNIKRSARRAS